MELTVKGDLCCLAMGQTEQIKDCLEESKPDKCDIDYIFEKGK